MSGWLAVRSTRLDADLLAPARGRASGAVSEWTSDDGLGALLAWRREAGEHRPSGRLYPGAAPGGRVAWVGLCLENGGDSTAHALELLRGRDGEGLDVLNGEFAAAVASPSGAIDVVSDRHGHYPVFIVRAAGLIAASTDPSAALAYLERPRIDREAADLLLRCGELLDDRAPLEGVSLLPPASWARLDPDAGLRPSRYWHLRHEADPSLGEAEAAAAVGDALRRALRRLEASGARLVAPLSGGLDSRLILGLCERPERVPSYTWGTPGCRDLRYAALFARRIGSPHHAFELRPDPYPAAWARGVSAVGGCVGVRDMYILPFAPTLAEGGDVALNGLAGDAFLGGNFLRSAWMKAASLDALAEASWRWRAPEPEASLTAGLLADGPPAGHARELWIRSIRDREDGRRPIEILVDWLLDNRVFRVANAGTQLLRTAVESWSPFFDRDVVDLLARIPLEYRQKHRLYLATLTRACPAAAEIPWQRTGIAPRWGFGAALAALAFHRGARVVGRSFGLDPFPAQAVASPAEWFRGPWAPAARAILFDERTLERGVLNPDALRRLWSAHQDGVDASRSLGAAISLELLAREAVDVSCAERRA